MFQSCSSLEFVNFSSLDTSSASYMGYMFSHCSSLKYINFGDAKRKSISYEYIFADTNNNLIICGKNIDWNNLSYPPKNLTLNICPICGKNSEFGLWNHLIINDKTHNDLLYQYIAFLYQEFNNKKFNQYHYTSFLKYKEILSIWKHLNLDVNAREKEVRDYVMKHNKEYYFQNRKFNAIRGYRKDLDLVCNSSWEANIYRILKYNHSRFKTEIAKDIIIDNKHKTYYIDCLDIDGFFQKGAYLEIKGCMTDDNKKKIAAFKQQYPNETLLIIGDSKQYPCDYDYYKVIEQYKVDSIYWETLNHNPRTNPNLYIK